ncbi:MAG: cystathionine beta-lyase [Salinisphaera sp.]|jgi:cystathionine beta-lyase|nr:cystathionine beta-lyase [Salinisphaera sp.]
MKTATQLVHSGRDPAAHHGMVNVPAYHGSTVLFDTLEAFEASQASPFTGVHYGRFGTPTHFAFEQAVARLENAYGAVSTCSGLAAIAAAVMSVAEAGAHLLVADSVYGPTRMLCNGLLKRLGVETEYFDPTISADQLQSLFRANTRALFVEPPGSLTFEISDVPAMAAVAHAHDAVVIADNTWATPLYYNAHGHGVDISVHAATKYMVGHSDALLGVVNCIDETTHERVKMAAVALGYCAGPDDVYLGLRGLRTLGQRLPVHQSNGLALANWLADQPQVARVIHPARLDHPQHALWQRDFTGATGLFSFVLQPVERSQLAAMLDGLAYYGMGASWGGYESLIIPANPARSRSATEWSTTGPMLRVHAGLEDIDDLIDDMAAGLARLD